MTMGWSRSSCEIWGQMVVFQCPKMTINDMTVENSCVCHGTPPGGAGSYPQCLRNVQQQASGVLHVQNPECLLLKSFFPHFSSPLSFLQVSPKAAGRLILSLQRSTKYCSAKPAGVSTTPSPNFCTCCSRRLWDNEMHLKKCKLVQKRSPPHDRPS